MAYKTSDAFGPLAPSYLLSFGKYWQGLDHSIAFSPFSFSYEILAHWHPSLSTIPCITILN